MTDALKTAGDPQAQNQVVPGSDATVQSAEIESTSPQVSFDPEVYIKALNENKQLREAQSKQDRKIADLQNKLSSFEEDVKKKKPAEERLAELEKALQEKEAFVKEKEFEALKFRVLSTFPWKETPQFARETIAGVNEEELVSMAKALEVRYAQHNESVRTSAIKGATAADPVLSSRSFGEHIFTRAEIAAMSDAEYEKNREKIQGQASLGLLK